MAKKFYVIWQGRETGIFTDWSTCKKHVDGFTGAKYKSFKTLSEAEAALQQNSQSHASPSATKDTISTKKKIATHVVKTYTAKEVAMLPINTKIFTDGGCEPNPGKAGSGMAVYRHDVIDELWYGLYNQFGTNNTAELNAFHQALIMAKKEISKGVSVAIFCDSKYSIQCITQWAVNWQKKGWKKNGGDIKNLELIKEMFALYQLIKNEVQVCHVNGHVGLEGNELADRMSILAIESKEVCFVRYRKIIDIPTILEMRAG